MTENFVELLQSRSRLQPDSTAFIFLNSAEKRVELSFGQLQENAMSIAAELQKYDLIGQRALLLYRSGIEFISAFFGCLYAKVIPVPVHPVRNSREKSRLSGIVENAEVRFVLTTKELREYFQNIYQGIGVLDASIWLATDNLSSELAEQGQSPLIRESDIAFLQYTSGSTGNPKGVSVTHGNLLYNQQIIQKAFQHSQETIVVGWLPFYHDMGLIGNIMQPLYLGITSILFSPTTFIQSPSTWLQTISHYRATTSGGPSFAYELCVNKITEEEMKGVDLSCWKVAFNGAEPVKSNVMQSFIDKFKPYGFREEAFYPCYGMAESTLFITGGNPDDKPVFLRVDEQAIENHQLQVVEHNQSKVLVGCGKTQGDYLIRIVNPETHEFCQSEEIGEIWIAGKSVAKGYWNLSQETKETFQAYLSNGEGPFMRTGDLGVLVDGELFITGRLKDLIIVRGRNHYPNDIESTVEQSHTCIRIGGVAALAVEENDHPKLVIIAEVKKGMVVDLDYRQVLSVVRRNISDIHGLHLHDLVLIAAGTLPKTSSGKIRRRHCQTVYQQKGFREVKCTQ